jgi:hypothetical protein
MSPWLSNNEDIRTRFYHALSLECPQHRGPFLAKCARNGAPRVIVEARKSEVGDGDHPLSFSRWRVHVPEDVPCLTDYFKTAFDFSPPESGNLPAVALAG